MQILRPAAIFLITTLSASAQDREPRYGDLGTWITPKVEAVAYDSDKVGWDAGFRRDVCSDLARVTTELKVSLLARARLLAVGLAADPDHPELIQIRDMLADGRLPEPLGGGAEAMARLLTRAEHFGHAIDPANNPGLDPAQVETIRNFRAYLIDGLHRAAPGQREIAAAHAKFFQDQPAVDWAEVLPGYAAAAAKEAEMAGVGAAPNPNGPKGLEVSARTHYVPADPRRRKNEKGATQVAMDILRGRTILGQPREAGETKFLTMNSEASNRTFATTLTAVQAHLLSRHPQVLDEAVFQFSFEHLIGGLLEPESRGLTFAVLAEALATGSDLAAFSSTCGTMDSGGKISGVPRQIGILRNAADEGVKLVVIPAVGRATLDDLMISGHAKVLTQLQVVLAEDFDDAWAVLSMAEGDPEMAAALADFSTLLDQLSAPGAAVMEILRSDTTIELLRSVLQRVPHHGSAAVLLATAEGRLPRTLSPNGSYEILMTHLDTLGRISKDITKPVDGVPVEDFLAIAQEVTALAPKLDPSASDFAAKVVDAAHACRRAVGGKILDPPVHTFGIAAEAAAAKLAESDIVFGEQGDW